MASGGPSRRSSSWPVTAPMPGVWTSRSQAAKDSSSGEGVSGTSGRGLIGVRARAVGAVDIAKVPGHPHQPDG